MVIVGGVGSNDIEANYVLYDIGEEKRPMSMLRKVMTLALICRPASGAGRKYDKIVMCHA